MPNSVVITTKVGRLSYANIHKPRENMNGDMQYSCCFMQDKKDKKEVARLNKCVQDAIKIGIESGKFNKSQVKGLKLPIHDGEEEYQDGLKGKEFDGCIYFSANSLKAPGIADSNGRPAIGDSVEIYSGCHARIHCSFYPFNKKGKRGVAVGLNHVMFVKDDERFDGRTNIDDAFKEFQFDDGSEEADGALI